MLDKIKNVISRGRYITEFITTFIFIFFLALLIYTKNYAGYFSKLYLIGTAIWFCILIINMIYNFIKSDKKIEKIFLNVAIPIGILYLVFMIPGHVPDEGAHLIKAYDVSLGHLTTQLDEDGNSYINVPVGLSNYNYTIITNYSDLINLAKTETDYSNTEQVISTAQGNVAIVYIFSALGFLIARIVNINIIYGIFLGRIFNFIFFLICGYFAIKKIPLGKTVFTIYMLMPMCLQQATSISADSFINSVLFYYITFSISIVFKKEKISKKEIITYIFLTALIGMLKMVYILIAGIGFLIIKRKDLTTKHKVVIITTTIVLGSIVTIATYMAGSIYTSKDDATIAYQEEYNIDSQEQVSLIISEPKHILKALFNDWYNLGKYYVYMAIGSQLGWLEIMPSETVITAYLILLIIATLSEKNSEEFDLKSKIWLILISVGIILLVEFAMYTSFTPVGAEFIGGVQGRYFIPVYILLLLCLIKKDNYVKLKNPEITYGLISAGLNICVITEVISYFI